MNTANRVIVCGCGIAGLSASITALEAGVQVALLEKAPTVGGSTLLSGGEIWTFADLSELHREIPDGDPILQRAVFDNLQSSLTWLEGQGVVLGADEPLGCGRGRRMDPSQAVNALLSRFSAFGGELLTDTGVDDLIVVDGAVTGIHASQGQSLIEMPAMAVVLATGGLQGNPELVARYIGPPANLYLRSNPWSTGDGFVAATRIGAAVTPGLNTFYGHALIAAPGKFDALHFMDVSQYYGNRAVALNLSGRRFADESEGTGEEVLNQQLATQPGGLGFYILDASIAAQSADGSLVTSTILDRARAFGANVIASNSLEELGHELGQKGLPPAQVLTTLHEYNDAIRHSSVGDLVPPRRRYRFPIEHAPFYAVGVKASITCSTGGLAVDGKMRVLRRSSTSSSVAQSITTDREYRTSSIPGLYAAGCDVGNINHRSYMGSLAPALVTGRLAGREAGRVAAVDR